MARKHPISPNQTVLWTWHSLSPAWGSRALHNPQETRKRPRRTTKKNSCTTEGKTHANTKTTTPAKTTVRPSDDRTQPVATGRNEQEWAGQRGYSG
jgi:hypothetical protein